jgi:phage terminase large subunit-like protein
VKKPRVSPSLSWCLNDPNLFAHHFRGKSWAAWKVFLAALFAEPADEAGLAVYCERTGRTAWPTAPFTEAAVIVGRRGGKSRTLALIAVYLACFRNYDPYLAPGEVATIGILAVDKGQARAIFRFVLGLLKAVPMLEPLIVRRDSETIELSNRVHIEIATASFRSTRGYTYAAVLADEVAFWRSDETSLNPDVEILRALRPGMVSIPGAVLVI